MRTEGEMVLDDGFQWSFFFSSLWIHRKRYVIYSLKAFYNLRIKFNVISKISKRLKCPISTLSHEFLHEMFLSIEIWYRWCIIDALHWKCPWTFDLLKSLYFAIVCVNLSWIYSCVFMCRLLCAIDLCIDHDWWFIGCHKIIIFILYVIGLFVWNSVNGYG